MAVPRRHYCAQLGKLHIVLLERCLALHVENSCALLPMQHLRNRTGMQCLHEVCLLLFQHLIGLAFIIKPLKPVMVSSAPTWQCSFLPRERPWGRVSSPQQGGEDYRGGDHEERSHY